MTTAAKITAETFAALPFVARANEWKDRVYINLTKFNKSFNADLRSKIWYRDQTITYEAGKGYHSDGYLADLRALEAWACENGLEFIRA